MRLAALAALAVLLLALVTSATAAAQADSQLVAVLPLNVADSQLAPSARVAIEESIRTKAGDVLRPLGLKVLTNESTITHLRDNGIDAQKACEASCAVDVGREMKARYVISGTIATNEDTHSAFIRLFDTKTGEMLSSIKLRGRSGTELEDQFDARGQELFDKAGVLRGAPRQESPPEADAGPVVKRNSVAALVADLTIDAKPRDRARLDIVDPSGRAITSGAPYKNDRAAPGVWKVSASAPGHAPETRALTVTADDVRLETLELKPLGAMAVSGTPAGAAYVVTGPNGFRDEGGLPFEANGIASGRYRLVVSRRGYDSFERDVEVLPGETTRLDAVLQKTSERGPPGTVRVHFKPARDGERWTLLAADDTALCALPCSRWVEPRGVYRVRLDAESLDDVRLLDVPPVTAAAAGRVLDATVSGARGSQATGIVLTSLGGIGTTIGGIFMGVAIGSGNTDLSWGPTVPFSAAFLAPSLALLTSGLLVLGYSSEDEVAFTAAQDVPGAGGDVRIVLGPGGLTGSF